ncbi:MAG TPA: GNAT family N-acetyltransferase, partial [Actinomycetota bacterium]|nr:GNAT family N-acetyltransferase [Actinomycetota bacterium]
MSIDIKVAGPEQKARVVDVILLAFAQDPIARWAFPDPYDYVTIFREFVPAFGGRAFDNESALH